MAVPQALPKAGHIAIYDRTWYRRVLVERVERFCSERMAAGVREINEIEEDYVGSSGGGIVKFWLEISKERTAKTIPAAGRNPLKRCKITEEDWRNREKWDLYRPAVDEMLSRTDTRHARWIVIQSDDKWFARVKTLKNVHSGAPVLFFNVPKM